MKALFACVFTVAVMVAVLDIRGPREWVKKLPRPEWLKGPAPSKPAVDMSNPVQFLSNIRKKIEEAKAQGGAAQSVGGEIDRGVVDKFLETEEAAKLITHPPSHFGAAWYFVKPEWIDRDIVRIGYEDGSRRGTMILKILYVKDGRPQVKVLSDSLAP